MDVTLFIFCIRFTHTFELFSFVLIFFTGKYHLGYIGLGDCGYFIQPSCLDTCVCAVLCLSTAKSLVKLRLAAWKRKKAVILLCTFVKYYFFMCDIGPKGLIEPVDLHFVPICQWMNVNITINLLFRSKFTDG